MDDRDFHPGKPKAGTGWPARVWTETSVAERLGEGTLLAALFTFGLALRVALIVANPALFGTDSVLRLAYRAGTLTGHQLPVVAGVLTVLGWVTRDATAGRVAMAVAGAAMGCGFYLMARHWVSRGAAFCGAMLCATHPFLTALATEPYQEPWMLGALFFGFHFLFAGRRAAASVALGVACFTRHEAWAACPVFAAYEWWVRGRTVGGAVRALALYGWAPGLWIAWSGGLAPAGGSVLGVRLTWGRLARYAYVGWITLKFSPAAVLALAAWGAWRARLAEGGIRWELGAFGAFVGLFLLALPLSDQGVAPDPERFVTSREASIVMAAAIAAAVFALEWLGVRWRAVATAVCVAAGVWGVWRYVAESADKPEVRLPYAAARRIDALMPATGQALVLAPPVDDALLAPFLERAYAARGERGLMAARKQLEETPPEAIEVARMRVYSRLEPGRLTSRTGAGDFRVAAVWSTYQGPGVEALAGWEKVETLRDGPLAVTIYRRSSYL